MYLHYGNGGKIFFCKRIRIFFFKKIRREKLLISEKYMVAIKILFPVFSDNSSICNGRD